MLRQLLLGAKLCDEQHFVEAAAQAEADGTSALAELVRRGSVDCGKLATLLAEKSKLPILPPEELATDEEAIRTLPFDAARALLALPLQLDLDARPPRMKIAMANPLDDEARREIEKISGFRCEVALARGTDLEAAIGRAYASLITRSIPRRTPYAVTQSGKSVEPSTRPTHDGLEHSALERRVAVLTQLLVDKGVITLAELDERLKKPDA